MSDNEQILIIGGAGFIGHNLSIYFKRKGYDVTALDSLERPAQGAPELIKKEGIDLIKHDIKDLQGLVNIIKGFSVVIHCAAYIDVQESFSNPIAYLENNVVGTACLVKSCIESSVKRLVYLSSAAVYGNPSRAPINEDSELRPVSPYGLSKLLGEKVVEFYSEINHLSFVTLRVFNVYGPRQSSPYSGVISKFVSRVKKGLEPVIFGDGKQVRDFIHVEDLCKAVELATKTSNDRHVYNIGSGKGTTVEELAKLAIKIAGLRKDPVYEDERPGDIRYSIADISKARAMLGFKPSISLEEGLTRLIKE